MLQLKMPEQKNCLSFPAILLWAGLFMVLITSCKSDAPYTYSCQDGAVAFELLNDELNPRAYLYDPGQQKQSYRIIQDNDELYKLVHIAYLRKKVDFKSKSLIVISINLETVASVTQLDIEADCQKKKLIIDANLKYASTPETITSYVFAIVPKVTPNTTIQFTYQVL
ncbi:hypothetical protein [Dyadobacter sandarakinus]|uniref:DUF4377 domain-containing protein n=1 Tax=Dyadobacter sandarakinus TaxID=2747268 RepID=A0ABX7I1J6_9BACT|nr:hypothetical protein [Dyadobacter sandarakinus]QRQ99794.1 hypothetical protein HWI92_02095 [Dyadobacter sandarakinus]